MATRELVVKIRTEGTSQMRAQLGAVRSAIRDIGLFSRGAFSGLAGSLAGILGARAIANYARDTVRLAADIKRQAAEADLTTREYQQLGFVLDQLGIPIASLREGFRNLARVQKEAIISMRAGKPNEYVKVFQDLGINVDYAGGKVQDATAFLYEMKRAFDAATSSGVDATDWMARLIKVLPETGPRFRRFFDEPIASLREMRREADQFDIDDSMIDKAERAEREWSKAMLGMRVATAEQMGSIIVIMERLTAVMKLAVTGLGEIFEIAGGGDTEGRAKRRASDMRGAAGKSAKAQAAFGAAADIMEKYARPLTEEEKRRAEAIAKREGIRLPSFGLTGNMEQSRREMLIQEEIRGLRGGNTYININRNFNAGGMRDLARPFAPAVGASRGG